LVNINAKEERTKEAWVKIMGAREARNSLRECYRSACVLVCVCPPPRPFFA